MEEGVMKILSLKLPEALLAQITSMAKERGESRSALVREAIETFIAVDNRPQGVNCLDLARDLVGSVKGPVDLSFNKKHLHGYGR